MKYYKINNAEIVRARHNEPLECVGADGVSSFYISQSDEELNAPFVEIQEGDLPSEIRERMEREEAKKAEVDTTTIERKEQEVREALASFESSALGKRGIYDSDLVWQANLLQAFSLGKGGRLRVRCDGEEKQYVFHTKEQVKQVMSDWVRHKDRVLSEFEEFKKGG
ncbi:hypothetical protein BBW65_06965 [Helicobacter enhydrae]|uniref:Uncharacterized protein n=1 Tax=Helicobacter enhydrae TaxID=222136 RepID=A0A1B1U704_9HELI|nr:hypothetical protein [Helicobacter enhydrae]ANV98549.1 hypothetical protein BBW65_06965 [Helicobacter enhydrae]